MGAEDLQSAGVVPSTPDDPGSLLKAMSMGGGGLAYQGSPLQQARANPDMQNWAGLAGFGAGLLGQQGNPVVNQVIAAQQQDMQSRLATARVMESAMRLRREQQKDHLVILRDLAAMDNPDARKLGWTGISKITGIQIPPPMLEGLTTGSLNGETMNRIAAQVLAGWDDQTIAKFNPGTPPESIAPIRQYAQSDAAKAALKIETRDKLEKRMLDEEVKRYRIQLDELKQAQAQEKIEQGNRRLGQIDTRLEQQWQAVDIARKNAETHAKWVEGRLKDLGTKVNTKEARRLETLNVLADALNMMETHSGQLNTKGYLPRGTSILDAGKASATRALFPGDPDWVAWKQLQASLVGFDRTILNDIGARAFQAFKNQFAFFDNPPPKAAIDQAIANMRRLLKDAKEGKLPEMETVTIKLPNGKFQKSTNYRAGDPLPPGAEIIRVE